MTDKAQIADEPIVCALEKAGILVGMDDDGEVTWEFVLHGISRLAQVSDANRSENRTLRRYLHKSDIQRQGHLDQNAKLAERLTALEEKYSKMSKFATDQAQSLAIMGHALSMANQDALMRMMLARMAARRTLPPIEDFALVRIPGPVSIVQPGGLILPKHATLWVAHSCLELETRVESYEDWRIRQAEELVLGVATFDASSDDARRQRGKDMALDLRIHKTGLGLWSVPSHATSYGRRLNVDQKLVQYYTVDTNAVTCTCIDYGRRKKRCKHIYAVEHLTSIRLSSQRYSKQASFAQMYGGLTAGKLASLSGLRSGRFSHKHHNLMGIPRPQPVPIDWAALEARIVAGLGMAQDAGVPAVSARQHGVKVTSFIHDELTLEVTVQKPAATIPLSFDVAYEEK